MKSTHLWRRDTMGGIPISTGSPRRGGVGPRVGGVSDTPDEPAVYGRVSEPSMGEGGSRRGVGFLRVGTPSGQVHCAGVPTSHSSRTRQTR